MKKVKLGSISSVLAFLWKLESKLTLLFNGELADLHLSALNWVAISWTAGTVITAPLLILSAHFLDHGPLHHLQFGVSAALGALFCLPTGFFRSVWPFPLYISAISSGATFGLAAHTRHLGLMIRGATGNIAGDELFTMRKSAGSRISVYGTAAGGIGAAIISSFAYRMAGHSDKFSNLWIVSIFSGIIWLVGIAHYLSGIRPPAAQNSPKWSASHAFAPRKYPHAVGTLAGVFLSSFATMCIFAATSIHLQGKLCYEAHDILYTWLIYFLIPTFSLPLLRYLQLSIKSDAMKMQVAGLLAGAVTSGTGFYFQNRTWHREHLFFFTMVQGVAAGILHTYGRVLLVDCSPAGKEGAFSACFAWVKMAGTCAGFTIATSFSGVTIPFSCSFLASILGFGVFVFGNVSNKGGVVGAGHGKEEEGLLEGRSPVNGFDTRRSSHWKGSARAAINLEEEIRSSSQVSK
ncbi:hypothetical protein AMTR_s00048p00148310 [Amborella trichopoda]|uniref:Major facilitator superfamily (MFS) profile domain-containing protein n=1 Tax=Amborella trichopoda TaxID=13333 RepID=U5D038_AMBTC|nr:hypothetical protein AMTR_s00048p00148310 [Amborella trichopoda]